MSEARFVKAGDVEQVKTPAGFYRRTMGITDHAMLLEVFLPRETVVPEHSHMHEQIGYVVYGKIELTIEGKAQVLEPGDGYAVPGNIPHSAHALIDTVLVECFSPPREDFR